MSPKAIPDGWLTLSAIGKVIAGTKFLPFKVPLKDGLCNNLELSEQFSPTILMKKEPKLQLIIDLTNTARYYNKNEFISNGVQHFKIYCPGKMVPPTNMMNQFFEVVDKFMKSANDEEKYIGVHCTHGINRTGYFICNYMINKLGYTVENAISAFQEARGHEIQREYLIDELNKINTYVPLENNKNKKINYPDHVNQSIGSYSGTGSYRRRIAHRGINSHKGGNSTSEDNRPLKTVERYLPRGGPYHQKKYPLLNSDNKKCTFDHYSRQSQLNYYDNEQSGSNFYQNSFQNNRYRKWNEGGNFHRGEKVHKEKDSHMGQKAPKNKYSHNDTNTKRKSHKNNKIINCSKEKKNLTHTQN